MAEKFVQPLIEQDILSGYFSALICDNNKCNKNSYQIKFKIKFSNFFYIIFNLFYISVFLKYKKITHVFVHNSSTALIPLLAAKLLNIKHVIYFNHGVPYIGYERFNKIILLFLEKINCLIADHIITVSNDMKKELKKVSNKKISIIHNGSASGIDLKAFNKENFIKSEIKKKLNVPENSFIIVYVGRIEDRKGYGFLMQIWKRHFQGNKDYTLLICGGKKKNLNHPNIKYLGFVDNIPEVLSISNCLLLPSKHEGLPYAVLESLASGCPIIASKIPGTSSIIKNNSNGILVKDFNIHKYYQKITKLKTDSNFKIKLIKNGLVTSKNYDRIDFLKAYTNLFKSLISKKTN